MDGKHDRVLVNCGHPSDRPPAVADKGITAIRIVKVGPVLLVIAHRVSRSDTPEIAATDLFDGTFAFRTPAAPRARR